MRETNKKMTDKITEKISDKEKQDLQLKIDGYSDMLFKLCFLHLQSRQDAEDVVQETLYQYLKREKPFESPEHEKAWLVKVALNGCRRLWRSAWYRHRCRQDAGELSESGMCPDDCSEKDLLEEGMLKKEADRLVLQAVMELPVKYRDVIHLFYYEELSVKEIADATGRKESTVTSQLTRGREMLKRSLKEDFEFA